jgi:NADPH2:quinone reductase
MKAIRVHELGSSDVLSYEEVPTPKAGKDEVVVKLEYIGVNFSDTGQREGRTAWYEVPLPFTPGNEGSGTVAEVGPGVSEFKPGEKVAYRGVFGAYAEFALVPADKVLHVPAGFSMQVAAGCLTQGMTAYYVTHDAHQTKPGEWVLVHAAAGGTGSLVVQMAKNMGAVVVATASTEEKSAIARENGADHVFIYTRQDFEKETRKLPGFDGFHAVFDSVSASTFEQGLRLMRPLANMVVYGMSSGPVPPFDINRLNPMGSLSIRRTNLKHYVLTREALLFRASAVFEMIRQGKLRIRIGKTYPLAQAKQAHDDLEGRRSVGKLLLVP